mmetsp:Transcript_15076/g.32463  ORF Transcript_15076/g.32463 Transcript_15076/m.32463 type:complete len:659 (-) Transcript_15076:261-2237(-)
MGLGHGKNRQAGGPTNHQEMKVEDPGFSPPKEAPVGGTGRIEVPGVVVRPDVTAVAATSTGAMEGTDTMTSTPSTGLAALAQRPSKSTTAQESLVDTATLMQVRGTMSVTGRYFTDRPVLEDYSLDSKVVGSGMSGPVQLATSHRNGTKVAIKSFKKTGLSSKKRNELKSEVEIYLSLDHPHIASLERVYESRDELHLVMEYMAGGELYDRLSAMRKYTEEDAARTAYMMLLAVAYLHAHQIAHRDLKLENFLYEEKEGPRRDHLKLIDFGFAKFWDPSTKMSQACGSVHYVAPEVLYHSYTEKADLWSLGVITYMLLTGSPPFLGNDDEVLKKIKTGQVHWSSRFHRLSPAARNFVKNLLVLDPKQRYSSEAALNDEWIQSREKHETSLDMDTLQSLKTFGNASSFKRAVVSMMAWSLESDERAELRAMFLSMDKERTGTIKLPQMKEVLEEHFHINHIEAERLFKIIDNNNDNEIEYSEFLAAACLGRLKVHEDLLRKTFEGFDTDGSGKISSTDLKMMLGEEFEGSSVEDLLKQVDANNDGQVDYEEFISYFYSDEASSDDADGKPETEDFAKLPERRRNTEKMAQVVDRLAKVSNIGHASFHSLPDAAFADAQSPQSPVLGSPGPHGSPRPMRRKGKAATFCFGMSSEREEVLQ